MRSEGVDWKNFLEFFFVEEKTQVICNCAEFVIEHFNEIKC